MPAIVRLGDRALTVNVDNDRVTVDDATFTVTPIDRGIYRLSRDGRHWIVAVAGPSTARWVWIDGRVEVLDVSDAADRGRTRRRSASHELTAPMPATVTRVVVAPHTAVKAGDVLLMLEAMKMELAVRAPQDGTVGAIHCKAGDLVQPGVPLLEFA
jgi:3-methylcrotonyl-CoA carboxylase alpha subunit